MIEQPWTSPSWKHTCLATLDRVTYLDASQGSAPTSVALEQWTGAIRLSSRLRASKATSLYGMRHDAAKDTD